MRIGIQLPEVERVVPWSEYVAIAQAAEEVGFDSIWMGDHLLYRQGERGDVEKGPLEAWTLMSALAAVTERVTIGPLVACLGFHPPGLIAKMAATIDEVSGGRFICGVGAGWNEGEFRAFSIPYDKRVSRFEESFGVLRRMLAGERVSFSGKYVDVEDAVLLPPPERQVPLMIGSNGPRMLGIALPWVQWWNTWFDGYGNSAEGFAELNSRISAACRDAGREPGEVKRSACVHVVVDRGNPERRIVEDAPPLEGTISEVAARLAEWRDAGADEVILVAGPIDEASVRWLGDVVGELRSA